MLRASFPLLFVLSLISLTAQASAAVEAPAGMDCLGALDGLGISDPHAGSIVRPDPRIDPSRAGDFTAFTVMRTWKGKKDVLGYNLQFRSGAPFFIPFSEARNTDNNSPYRTLKIKSPVTGKDLAINMYPGTYGSVVFKQETSYNILDAFDGNQNQMWDAEAKHGAMTSTWQAMDAILASVKRKLELKQPTYLKDAYLQALRACKQTGAGDFSKDDQKFIDKKYETLTQELNHLAPQLNQCSGVGSVPPAAGGASAPTAK